ncbi:hypothetical protein JW824_15340 [bacterium]|nr:hypothetical protein [bacterium]
MKSKAVLSILLSTIILLSCAVPSTVSVRVQKPASIDLPGIRKIAIVDFQGDERSGSQIAVLIQSLLLTTDHFDILERDQLRRILEEQNLGMSGVVDASTAVEVGQLLGVDALIFGEVTTYDVEPDQEITEKIKEQRRTGRYQWVEEKDEKTGETKRVRKEIIEDVWVDKSYWVRKGTVAINFRFVDVETGVLLAAHSDSKSYDSQDEKRTFLEILTDQQKSLKPQGEILHDLSHSICLQFVRMIAPYYTMENRVIESGKGSIDEGRKYAENGLWPEAMEAWERAVAEMEDEPAAYYNLGLGYEIQGLLDEAEEYYQLAVRITQKKLYMEAIARVRQLKEEQEKLIQQLDEETDEMFQ